MLRSERNILLLFAVGVILVCLMRMCCGPISMTDEEFLIIQQQNWLLYD